MMPKRIIERRASSGFAPCPELLPGVAADGKAQLTRCPGVLTLLVTATMVVTRCTVSGRLVEATRIVDEPHPWWSR